MAHAVTTQVLVDGSRNTIIKVNIKGDGASGELTNSVIFDASAYTTASTDNKLMRIAFCLNNFSAELFWDGTANVALVNLEKDISEDVCYKKFGGIINNAAAGRTGDILITTNGLNASANEGYIVFYMKQREVPVIR